MDNRTRALAILNYEPYDRLLIVHFGYWRELLARWANESHVTQDGAANWADGNLIDQAISSRPGYIPCSDHRIPGDVRWENVQYYCEKMRRVFG